MPIFEYRCRGCGSEFELLVPTAAAPVSCPGCGGGQVKKLISLFAVSAGSREPTSRGASGCAGCSSRHCSTCR